MKVVNDITHVKGSDNYLKIDGKVLYETEEAIQFQGKSEKRWFPKKVLVKETKTIHYVNYYVHKNFILNSKTTQLKLDI
jgi:hypothetical protein